MLTLAFAETGQAAAEAPQQSPFMSLLPILLIFVIFYFLLIKPQKKAQQDHAKMLEGLQKNDEIITSGGIHGTIISIQDDVVTLRIDDNVKIKVQKSSISRKRKVSQEK